MDRSNQPSLVGTDLALPPAGWDSGPGPLHHRLSDAIEDLVRRGELAPGTTLPTERELARAASVSRATAAAAYRRLRAAGRIDSRQGRGTWVREVADPAGRAPAEGIAPVLVHPGAAIDLALTAAEPEPEVRAALAEAISRGADAVAGPGYEPAGATGLRAALADRPEEVLVTSGAQQALSLVAEELVRPGDVVVVEEVTYVGALDAARRVGARLVAVPTGVDGVDVDALVAAIARHRPALVYLGPTHHSPTGAVVPDAARARVVDAAARHGTHVVDDRSLADLPFDDDAVRPRPLRSFDLGARVVTIGSLSKSVWAGLRVGWVRADPSLVARLVARRMVHDLGGDLVGQHVALALLDAVPGLARRRAGSMAARHRHLGALLASRLPDWVVAPARGGMSAWVHVPTGGATRFARAAAEHGVHVVPGPVLSPHGGADDHLRISLTQPDAVLDEAVDRLARAWAAWDPARP